MSAIVRRFCDCCGTEFTSTYWDHSPATVSIKMTNPAQAYESYEIKEVCHLCRRKVHQFFNELRSHKDIPVEPSPDKAGGSV